MTADRVAVSQDSSPTKSRWGRRTTIDCDGERPADDVDFVAGYKQSEAEDCSPTLTLCSCPVVDLTVCG